MKASRFPHSLALIFGMIVAAQLITYCVPAGEYQMAIKVVPLVPEVDAEAAANQTPEEAEKAREAREEALRIELPEGVLRIAHRDLVLENGTSLRLPDTCALEFDGTVLAPATTSEDPSVQVVATPEGDQVFVPAGSTIVLEGLIPVEGRSDLYLVPPESKARVPEGSYRRVAEDRKIDADSFALIDEDDAPSLPRYSFLTLIPKGLEKGAEIIFFVFIVGGVIAVIRATGAIDALIAAAIRKLGHNRLLLVAGMTGLFAVGSSTIGMAEEYMAFIPILVAMSIALGLDAIVAMGIVYIGAGIGYGCASLNPFTVAIAKDIAGSNLYDGFWLRWALLGGLLVVGVHHIMRYAKKISADPARSLVADVDYSEGYSMPEDTAMTSPRVTILALFAAGIAFFIVGVPIWGFYLDELAAIFLALAIIGGLIGGLSGNDIATRFCSGAAELTTTALLIGFARTIEVTFEEAKVIHTIIHDISNTLNSLDSPALAANGMLLVQSACNFMIPSGSGQAYVTMPIMAPVAELTHVGKETAVLAYQFGDGFTNMIVPTNALLMGMLALGKIPYQRWLRFILPLMVKIYIVAIVVLAIAGNANYGSS